MRTLSFRCCCGGSVANGVHPRKAAGEQGGERESACKPGSVEDDHSSGMHVAVHLKRPTRKQRGPRQCFPIWSCSGWGLPCHRCYHRRGALLPHHFTLTGPVAGTWAVYFLWHFPWAHAPQVLPGTLPIGARTFLCDTRPQRPSGRLPRIQFRPRPGEYKRGGRRLALTYCFLSAFPCGPVMSS